MSLKVKSPAGTPDIAIHSVHIKGADELPVTFLKSIKSVGNSVIITDFVPAYDWITIADIKLGDVLSPSSSYPYIIGAGYAPSGSTTGFYAASLQSGSANSLTYYAYQGNAYGDSGNYSTSTSSADIITGRNQLTMRRGNAGSQFGALTFTNTTTATRTDIHATVAIGGLHTYNPNETILVYNNRHFTIYGVKFCDNVGVTLHDLVPAKSKITNRAGLYDLTTKTFYPSHSDYDDFTVEV